VEQSIVIRLVCPDLAEPPHSVAVELELVDCLPGADVPQLRRTVGRPVASAVPTAKNAALRSSRITVTSMAGSRQSATASGVDREPGETTARRTPQRASSSAIAEARAMLRLVGSIVNRLRLGGAPSHQR
jgi:hypothetical protein